MSERPITIVVGDMFSDDRAALRERVRALIDNLDVQPDVDHALTALLYRRDFSVEDRLWSVVSVYRNGTVLMRREDVETGPHVHRTFPQSVLSEAERARLDRW